MAIRKKFPLGVLKLPDGYSAEQFKSDWEKASKETGMIIYDTTDTQFIMTNEGRLRIPRKMKKRLIGTNNRHILICTISTFRQRMDTGRKYFIQISKK